MYYKWIDFDNSPYEEEIKKWCQDELSLRYATDEGDGIKEDYDYWRKEDGFIHNETCFCKVVLEKEQPVAVLIMLGGEGYPLNINPIIVNPALRGKSHCTRIIKELVEHTDKIILQDLKWFSAGIAMENVACVRAFEKAGFILFSMHPDGDFADYHYRK